MRENAADFRPGVSLGLKAPERRTEPLPATVTVAGRGLFVGGLTMSGVGDTVLVFEQMFE
jgi:hypothetical protein